MTGAYMKVAQTGTELHVGPAGWSYEDWKGIVYPKSTPRGFRGLKFLADYFNTVEINTSFYRPPPASYCKRWLADVEGREDFRFTAKLWQRFTHEREDWWTHDDVKLFQDGLAPLADAGKLGAVVVQFPWSFRYGKDAREWLGELAGEFGGWPLVVEVRSRGWLREEALAFIEGLGVGFCNIDQPRLRGNIPLTSHAFGPVGYLRMHGRNAGAWFSKDEGGGTASRDRRYDYLYSPSELDEVQGAIQQIAERVEQMYVIANNHYRGQAPANALQLMGRLSGEEPAVPELLSKHYEIA